MGNLVTKIPTNSVELNESNASDIVVYEQKQVKKDIKEKDSKSPPPTAQTRAGLFKNAFFGTLDPRSPSTFIARTPISFKQFRSSSKFNHQELNESLNESVDLDILTKEEQESLNSNKDLVDAIKKEEASDESDESNKLPDPRSPTNEIARTPILITDENKKTEDNLIRKITDKLIAAKISTDNEENGQKKATDSANSKKKSKPTDKNLIYEDESENCDRFSTPPKKINSQNGNDRTPLSCLANKARNSQPRTLLTSTPKGSKIPIFRERTSASRIPRRIE